MKPREIKNFRAPDEVRTFARGKLEVLNIGEGVVGKATFEPGWRWSTAVKPLVGTELCEVAHFAYHVSGRLHVQMQDGTEFEVGPGDVANIPPGHDAWVVGNEPVVAIDWYGATNYAKRPLKNPLKKAA